ncbi:DUF1270 family protein [Staphylococcus aureus]|uniref:DUF1270 family protein n=1 Tax=Staphylococcus aureus TaxID=1280 RepID=A0A517KMQ7_STAAU|nr:DUF1270 family protein [Staphylococcus aureus]MCC2077917.1 DUF1270 family protein [Staphylococcus aureus]MCP6297097.1 DUF1270 family protein [Klebsiella pneumoniae]QDS64658.1 DUF1270 family protein [Staphylococcus aureus]
MATFIFYKEYFYEE